MKISCSNLNSLLNAGQVAMNYRLKGSANFNDILPHNKNYIEIYLNVVISSFF